jgi:peptidoglycan/LPS O-acetylase OafA/YrhL
MVSAGKVPKTITPHHRLSIQGLRAIAVGTVVAFHAGLPVPGGFVGVDIFFVISGFVIAAMLQREYLSAGKINFKQFYFRRFKRLTPALALMVTITAAASALLLSPFGTQQRAALTSIGAMFLSANFVIARTTGGYFDAPAETNPLLHTWSLSVEEQFYLLFPAVVALAWLLARRGPLWTRTPVILITALALMSFALTIAGSSFVGASALLGFYSPLTRAWEFALGALLAITIARTTPSAPRSMAAAGVLGLILLTSSLWLITAATPFPGIWTLMPVAGTLLLLLAGTEASAVTTRLLSTKPMARIGDWSYSIYLWHWPFIVFALLLWPRSSSMPLIAATLAIAAGYCSYRWVENPIRVAPRIGVVPAALIVAIPTLIGLGLMLWADSGNGDPLIAEKYRVSNQRPSGWGDPECIRRIPVNSEEASNCQWNGSSPGEPIYLIGDSNAQHFSDGMISVSNELQRPLTTLGVHGCPLIDVHMRRKSDPSLQRECRPAYEALMSWLRKQSPGLVVMSSDSRYWRDDDYLMSSDGDFTDSSSDENARVLTQGLVSAVESLRRAGHEVVLLETIPQYLDPRYGLPESDCNGWQVVRHSCDNAVGDAKMPIQIADELQSGQRQSYREAADQTGAFLFDFRTYFCPQGECRTRIRGIDHYMPDGYHLSKTGSLALVQELKAAVEPFD